MGPAIAGIFAFGLEFLSSKYNSEIADNNEDASKFDDQYNHSLMFIYGAFLCMWFSYMVQVQRS